MTKQFLIIIGLAILVIFAIYLYPPAEDTPQPTHTTAAVSVTPGPVVADADVDGKRITAADAEPQNWLSHGRTYSEEHYSPLDRIHADNVRELGLAWYLDLQGRKGLEAIPLVVDVFRCSSPPFPDQEKAATGFEGLLGITCH